MFSEFVMTPPNDQYLLVGSDLELNCTYQPAGTPSHSSPEPITPSTLGPKYDTFNIHNMSMKMNSQVITAGEFVRYVNEATLGLVILNATAAHSGMYTCYYNGEFKTAKKVVVAGKISYIV